MAEHILRCIFKLIRSNGTFLFNLISTFGHSGCWSRTFFWFAWDLKNKILRLFPYIFDLYYVHSDHIECYLKNDLAFRGRERESIYFYLMSSSNQAELVFLEEGVDNISTERPWYTSIVLSPSCDVLKQSKYHKHWFADKE